MMTRTNIIIISTMKVMRIMSLSLVVMTRMRKLTSTTRSFDSGFVEFTLSTCETIKKTQVL